MKITNRGILTTRAPALFHPIKLRTTINDS